MMEREFLQHLLALGGERQHNFTPIIATASAFDESTGSKTVYQFDRTVMLDLETVGKFADARARAARQALQGKH
jgi:hypothetical protein